MLKLIEQGDWRSKVGDEGKAQTQALRKELAWPCGPSFKPPLGEEQDRMPDLIKSDSVARRGFKNGSKYTDREGRL